jgi:hypothetical protein
MKVILSVSDEGYIECIWWRLFWVYLMKVILSVSDEGYFECIWWRLFWVYLMKVISEMRRVHQIRYLRFFIATWNMLIDWLFVWSVGWLVGWFDWLIKFVDWLIDKIYWLIDWHQGINISAYSHEFFFLNCQLWPCLYLNYMDKSFGFVFSEFLRKSGLAYQKIQSLKWKFEFTVVIFHTN